MATFEYRARNRAGVLIRSKVDAESAYSVASQLVEAGITPVRIHRVHEHPGSRGSLFGRLVKDRVTLDDLIVLSRQLFTLTHSGVPIIRGITSLTESTRNPTLSKSLADVAESLRSGRELSDSLRRHPKIFSPLFVSVVEVGENTGQLDDAFAQMAEYLELDRETRRRIKSATRYPIFVCLAVVIAMVILNLFVIPAFAKVFANFNAELPWATRFLIETSAFTVAYWHYLLALAAAGVLAAKVWLMTDAGEYFWDRLKLQIPAVGSIIERSTLSRYARSVSMTWSAGMPAVEALNVVARAANNSFISERLLRMRAAIERGESFTRAATVCGIFTPLILEMIAVGEETGRLADLHKDIADSYEAEVDYDLKRLSDAIEPLLIIGMGAVVLILALGVYLPMWDLATAVKR
jgi:MSHA biogenesis protein MshG